MWRYRIGHEWHMSQSQVEALPLSEFLECCAYLRITDRIRAGKG